MNLLFLTIALIAGVFTSHYNIDMTRPQPAYTDSLGYGYDRGTEALTKKNKAPMFFSVKVPEGDYKVTITLGSKHYAGITALRCETRRLVVDRMETRKGELRDVTFNVNVHTPYIDGKKTVSLHKREIGEWGWDNRLTLEFNGEAPAVSRIRVEPNHPECKIWLCGNSTVTDQDGEPYASWGQMLPFWFNEQVSVENLAMSGLRTTSFIQQNRLEKIKKELRKGDYVIVEFGHNDEKDRHSGSGAWYNFSMNLKTFIDELRPLGAQIILVTPTERRNFQDGKAMPTHGDYPVVIRSVAEREGVSLIDLTVATTALFNAMGEEGSKHLLVHYPMGTFPGQQAELKDNTHANAFGAFEISKLVIEGLKALHPDLLKYLRADWPGFSPSQPDDWQQFYWPLTPTGLSEKPAGN
jgi:lysophospholipase L1-like esterase